MKHATLTHLIGAAVTAAALTFAGAAAAQNQAPTPQQQAPAQVSDQELKSFAEATVEVQKISQDYEPRIQSAPDQQAGQELRQQAQAEMVSAVEAKGLTVEKYQEIYHLAQLDPQVRQRVASMIEMSR